MNLRDPQNLPELNGSWERAGRNSTAAAFFGFVIIGILYFHAQAILGGILFVADMARTHTSLQGKSFIERLTQMTVAMKGPLRVTIVITQFLCMLLPTLWIVKRWHSTNIALYLRFNRFPILEMILAVVITLCMIPFNDYIIDFFVQRLHIPDFLSRINGQLFTSYSRSEFVWLLIVVCFTPAICEEVLFRGYLQRTLERKLGVKSIFITGVLFGLYHMRPINLIPLIVLGLLFGFFFYRSQNILPGMAAHFTNNLVVILSLYKTGDDHPVMQMFTYELTLPGIAAALCFAGILLLVYYLITKRDDTQTIV